MQVHADDEMDIFSEEVKVSLVQLVKCGAKANLLGKEFPGSVGFIGSGPMGIRGVIKFHGRCDPRTMAAGHSFGHCVVEGWWGWALVLLKRKAGASVFEGTGCLVCLAVLHCFKTFPAEDVLAASGC